MSSLNLTVELVGKDKMSNLTLNGTQPPVLSGIGPVKYVPDPIESKFFRYAVYLLLFVMAVGGNIAVIFVPIRQKRMRNFTYYLITNLAVSDIGAMLCLPPLLVSEYFDFEWMMGEPMCKLVNPALTMFGLITTNSLVAIAVDRFMALVFPFKRRPNVKESALVISLTWLVAFGLVLPSFGARKVGDFFHEGQTYPMCREHFPDKTMELTYNVSLYLINNTIPILIISAVYAVIIIKLRGISFTKMFKRKSSKDSDTNFAKPNGLTSDEYYKKQKHERERKFTKMLLSVVVVFVLFYVPVQTYFFLLSLNVEYQWKYTLVLYPYLFLMSWVPNALNPILYGSMNEQYAKAFKRIFRCKTSGRESGSTTRGSYSRAPMTMQSRNDDGSYTINKDAIQTEM